MVNSSLCAFFSLLFGRAELRNVAMEGCFFFIDTEHD